MAKRLDLKDVNIYYGSFLAVDVGGHAVSAATACNWSLARLDGLLKRKQQRLLTARPER